MTAYIRKLEQLLAADPGDERGPKSDLKARVSQWYLSIPEIARQRPFAMAEIEAALGTQGKYLSPILLEFGWRRGRKWSSRGQYNRYWLPPDERTRCCLVGPDHQPHSTRTSWVLDVRGERGDQ